jgi:adenylosuccinate synthase
MPVRIIVGINWGDEGKGKMVDYFSRQADYVIRFQGGNNAGHTIENEYGNFKLHLIPSGIFYPDVVNIMGPGTVIDLEAAVQEINSLKERGIAISPENYKISNRAIISFPFNRKQDEYEELRLGSRMFGSTRQGIAPIYGDRCLKQAVQTAALHHPDYLKEQIIRCLELKNRLFEKVYQKEAVSPDETLAWALRYGEILKPYLCDTVKLLNEDIRHGSRIILEGQLGALRDVIYGIYPFSTSSSTIAAFGAAGSGYFGKETARVTGILKAFSTCVGEGPFVTEIMGEPADRLREIAFEYGATTGRPRRLGHFDAVASRYGVIVSGADEVALTKLDSLTGQSSLKICTHYRLGGQNTCYFPTLPDLVEAEPVYLEMPGWQEDLRKVREYDQLPPAARDYVEKIEQLVKCRIAYISVGPQREALIIR